MRNLARVARTSRDGFHRREVLRCGLDGSCGASASESLNVRPNLKSRTSNAVASVFEFCQSHSLDEVQHRATAKGGPPVPDDSVLADAEAAYLRATR